METAIFARGLSKKWEKQSQPGFALISKTIQELSATDNGQSVQLKQKLRYIKNAVHVEYLVNMSHPMLAVQRQVKECGMLRRLLGREIAILKVGYWSSRADAPVQYFLRAAGSNLAFDIFHTLVYFKHILYPGLKFKVEFADGTFPEKGKRMMMLQRVPMNLEVQDTKEESTFKKAFAQVGPVH